MRDGHSPELELPASEHIELETVVGRPYLNLYRFGAGAGPLVLYVGGAVTRAVYEARRSSAPTLVAAAFDRARRQLQVARVDLAISPCPIDDGGDPDAWIGDVLTGLASRIGAPSSIVSVGYSAGGALALRLAVLEESPAAAVFGGAGVPQTLDDLRTVWGGRATDAPLAVGWWMNLGDPLGMGGTEWMRRFAGSIDFRPTARPGQHPFADYDANQSVEDAFRFVLERLPTTHSGPVSEGC
jgi:dienelactone hydrolase